MRRLPVFLAATLLVLLGTPAMAASNCNAVGSGPMVNFQFHVGDEYSEEEESDFAMMYLRQRGVDATRVERWGGCYRAFVRQPGGGQRMEYFNAETLEPVDD